MSLSKVLGCSFNTIAEHILKRALVGELVTVTIRGVACIRVVMKNRGLTLFAGELLHVVQDMHVHGVVV